MTPDFLIKVPSRGVLQAKERLYFDALVYRKRAEA
jgi:hypothetical protein